MSRCKWNIFVYLHPDAGVAAPDSTATPHVHLQSPPVHNPGSPLHLLLDCWATCCGLSLLVLMICLFACLLFANACLPGSSKNLIVPFLLTNTYLSSYLWILRTLTCLLKFPYLHLYLWKSMKTHLQKEQLLIWTDNLWHWSTPVITNRRFYCSFAYAARKNFLEWTEN